MAALLDLTRLKRSSGKPKTHFPGANPGAPFIANMHFPYWLVEPAPI